MLTTELSSEVRDKLDEANVTDVSPSKILAALNRAQQKLARLSSRHFPEMLRRTATFTSFTGSESREVEIPSLSQSFIVTQVDVLFGGVYYPVDYANTNEVLPYEVNSLTSIPVKYTISGNKISFYPAPQAGITARIRYQLRAPKLVLSQGRITSLDTENGYLYLNELGDDLTTSTTSLGCFINAINKHTGNITGTYQVVDINTSAKRLTIKASNLYRTTVFGLSVSTSLSSDIEEDDYVTLASGTCIPIYYTDYTDYLAQFAVVEILRSLKYDTTAEYAALKELEDDVINQWTSRPKSARIQHRNRHWNRTNFTARR